MESADRQSPLAPVKVENQEDLEDLSDRLSRLPGPEYISTRSGAGNQKVHYLTGEKSSTPANEIFGTNSWSCSVVSVTTDELNVTPSSISMMVTAVVRVTCLYLNKYGQFASYEDVGTEYGEGSLKQKKDVVDRTKKGAVTDARKRALGQFGNALGLFLKDKDAVRAAMRQQVEQPAYNMHRKSTSVSRMVTPASSFRSGFDRMSHQSSPKRRAVESDISMEDRARLAQIVVSTDWDDFGME
ncbi:hypothetical protein DTO012A7_5309 [Penicillium roqueforti]|uniref:uncharacterized protein n=1 Tax=Penicillium roqueforti TaxID=5082 RepID=UPI00190D53CC|nr:uncharacterized protein LCP9604111_353 [Penicillium roqueforti]KAF9252827.1 hypothetical protein LCP9604111_353 [Penicillium roqueforti]KAI2676073.1 hypothetical protein CBS147355_6254 [Penicillium roqueforti]KAI2679240.1 hypothetical protein LCP963914a_7339 [Penicillium roqueforti]KAI2724161.1 hypothetical protein CBS147318_1092 [Penicillium roqueforti]KAI3132929.1 hypothetical protein CBS147330_4113 [Penicillium roqueforti]